jgi:hypothetical protein
MYKNTRSTSRTSVYRIQRVKVKINHGSYLKEIYECSKIIFVGRRIISQELFGKLPTTNYSVLIASNKKYLLKHGYASRYIDELPDWFLFHPRIDLLIKGLRDTAKTDPKVIPLELKLIAFPENLKKDKKRKMFATKIYSS